MVNLPILESTGCGFNGIFLLSMKRQIHCYIRLFNLSLPSLFTEAIKTLCEFFFMYTFLCISMPFYKQSIPGGKQHLVYNEAQLTELPGWNQDMHVYSNVLVQ